MAKSSKSNGSPPAPAPTAPDSITRITVEGFKSLYDKQSIEVRPLTILAGANSSGKSSIIQPLLLMKQTLEAPYDPGALLLDGPNVKFTNPDQVLARTGKTDVDRRFSVGFGVGDGSFVRSQFAVGGDTDFTVEETDYFVDSKHYQLHHDGRVDGVDPAEAGRLVGLSDPIPTAYLERCFLRLGLREQDAQELFLFGRWNFRFANQTSLMLIHVSGTRGEPLRGFPLALVSPHGFFPGRFENYFASEILHWQANGNQAKLKALFHDLRLLGLSNFVIAERVGSTVEVYVNRLPKATSPHSRDRVNIADVGLGVSHTLPVVVALHAALLGQSVYLEQPEIHLHPRAQRAMAEVLANAAKRGVKVIVETHSDLILLGVQTLVAQGKLSPDVVKLHWFNRNPKDGATTIASADLDADGRFGDWPQDFDETSLDANSRYLDAVGSNHGL